LRLISTKYSNFRGLKDDEHTFSESNIIIGDNGAGKTSLIEAIYVSLLGTPLNSFSKANKELSRNEEGLFLSESKNIDTKGVSSKPVFRSRE
jgi:Recombinational DNA repair ATPase (RecF pathway)